NIGDVLTVSPLLLEKYLAAAKTIVGKVVPVVPRVVAEHVTLGRNLVPPTGAKPDDGGGPPWRALSDYAGAAVAATLPGAHDGPYRLIPDLAAHERFVDGVNDYNTCRLIFRADGEELLRQEFRRQEGRASHFEFPRDWKAGPHSVSVEIEPLTPGQEQVRS